MALYNTDVYGIVRAFHDAFRTHGMTLPAQPNAVILGNGNTATSALAGCITMGCSGHRRCAAPGSQHGTDQPGCRAWRDGS